MKSLNAVAERIIERVRNPGNLSEEDLALFVAGEVSGYREGVETYNQKLMDTSQAVVRVVKGAVSDLEGAIDG